jgi:hypothetical protein
MPIDAGIYGRFAQDAPRLATIGEIQDAKAKQAETQEIRAYNSQKRKMEMTAAQEAEADRQAVQSAFAQHARPDGSVDQEAVLAAVAPRPKAYLMLTEQFSKGRKDATEARAKELETEAKRAERVAQIMQGIEDDDGYQFFRPSLAASDPELAEMLPEKFDPKVKDLIVSAGTSRAEFNKQRIDALNRDDDEESKVLNYLSLAQDPDDWQDGWEMAEIYGVTKRLQGAGLTPEFSPDQAQRAAALARTPEQRAQEASRVSDDERQEKAQQEIERHNRATEAIQAQQAKRVAAGAGLAGLSAGDAKLVDTIIANPSIYAGLTPTVKTRLASALAEKGFEFTRESTKPPTGLEKRALNFFNRAKQASDELEQLESAISGMGLAGQTRMEWAPNFMQSQTGQAYGAAQRAFTEARLRKDSGAAIPDSEFTNDRRTYFAQPGDSAETLAQKRRARYALLASLAYESGAALSEFYGEDARTVVDQFRAEAAGKRTTAAPSAPTGGANRVGRFTVEVEP